MAANGTTNHLRDWDKKGSREQPEAYNALHRAIKDKSDELALKRELEAIESEEDYWNE